MRVLMDDRTGRDNILADSLQFRRRLRRDSSDAEQLLWRLLRGRQFAGVKFRRQHPFGPYTLDFYCPERRLAIEADGGQHAEPESVARDTGRTRYLEARGIRVLRFTNAEVLRETAGVAELIMRALSPPSP